MTAEEATALTAKLDALQKAHDMAGTVNMEIFYWWCIALMVAIHAGFLAYEMGASRTKNVLASGVKNILAFAFIIPTMFLFGWWIYGAMPNGFIPIAATDFLPWDDNMGPNLSDNATGIFWAAFTLFSATTASIFSGAVLERIRMSGFIMLAVLLGSVVWIWAASWGWHPDGWMLKQLGYHDVGAAGVVHTIAGFFALGVLINLGPRVGKYAADGTPLPLLPHNMPLTLVGLMLIIVGFFGFLGGCIIYNNGGQWTNIYGQQTTLSAFAFNTLMGFSGGIIGAYWKTRDPFWMMSGALAGIFAAAAALDVLYPPVAFIVGIIGGIIVPMAGNWLERRGVDDAVGAWAVHGVGGFWGVLVAGIFASGYPNVGDAPAISFLGQLTGAVVCAAFGFSTGFVASYLLKLAGLLRVPDNVQMVGLDKVKVPSKSYPEFLSPAE
ncbi:MAG: ammonium transporter [Pseudomonadota bacterium]